MPEPTTTLDAVSPIVDASRAEVSRRFVDADDTSLTYHCLSHTEQVAAAADLIGRVMDIPERDFEALMIASWWHDVGMLTAKPSEHEAESARTAGEYLAERGYSPERIQLVQRLIRATNMLHKPADTLERAIRDADLSGLGRPNYLTHLKNLREEWDAQGHKLSEDPTQWLRDNIEFLRGHEYLTPAANRLYDVQKRENIALLEKRLKKQVKKERKRAKKAAKGSGDKSAIRNEKSAQMMLKTTLRNNIDLTSIADGKANIMLSINAAIIALGMPLLAAYIPEFAYLAIPGGILLLTCILTIYYATLATRPVKTEGVTDVSALESGATNLFFFGNYYKMPLKEYKKSLDIVLDSQQLLDDAIKNDLYYLGVTLGEKFNRLRICYAVFLGGMVITAVAFVITFYVAGPLDVAEVPANLYQPAGMDSLRR